MRFTRIDEGASGGLTAVDRPPFNEMWTSSVVPYARPQLLTFTVKNGLIPWRDRHISVRPVRADHTPATAAAWPFTFT